MRPQDVLDYWFGELDLDSVHVPQDQIKIWFMGGPEVDAEIREKFGRAVEEAHAGGMSDWAETAEGRLALIVLIDQFSRNVYRDDARAYDSDARCVELAAEGVHLRMDLALHPAQRLFFYLPFEHAEDRVHQATAVGLMTSIRDGIDDPSAAGIYDGFVDYALRHQRVVDRFGRFPHRNAMLERESTPEELEFLAGPDAPF